MDVTSTPQPASLPPRKRRRWLRRTLRWTALIFAGFILASLSAVILTHQAFNKNIKAKPLVEQQHNYLVEVGSSNHSIGFDLYRAIIHPSPSDPGHLPNIIAFHSHKSTRLHSPSWFKGKLPGSDQSYIPASLAIDGIHANAIGWPFRMYRSSQAFIHGPQYNISIAAIRLSTDLAADSPFRCPIKHGRLSMLGSDIYMGDIHWGSIKRKRLTDPFPLAIADHLKFIDPIPITPIWPGFILNIALYTAALWATLKAIALPSRLYTRWRRRGTTPCLSCGYDLAGLSDRPCPECGQTPPNPKTKRRHRPATGDFPELCSEVESPNKN